MAAQAIISPHFPSSINSAFPLPSTPTTPSLMASTLKPSHLIFMAVLCMALLDTSMAAMEFPNRKMLGVSGLEEFLKGHLHGTTMDQYGGGGVTDREELRWVPSGPDPLHHNGGKPKKPRTP